MLGKAEANDLNVTNYLSAMFLDVDRYTKAVASMNQQNNALNDRWVELCNKHVKDVKQFQANMQNTDFVLCASEEKNEIVCQAQLVGRSSASSKWAPEGAKNSVECAGRRHLPGERLLPLYNGHEEKETA